MKATALYVVIDEEGNVSFDAKKDKPEMFATFPRAEKRAKELARSEPGKSISIFGCAATVRCNISDPEITKA